MFLSEPSFSGPFAFPALSDFCPFHPVKKHGPPFPSQNPERVKRGERRNPSGGEWRDGGGVSTPRRRRRGQRHRICVHYTLILRAQSNSEVFLNPTRRLVSSLSLSIPAPPPDSTPLHRLPFVATPTRPQGTS